MYKQKSARLNEQQSHLNHKNRVTINSQNEAGVQTQKHFGEGEAESPLRMTQVHCQELYC